ncbi:MAG TPA: resistance to Congo red protein [Acidimicrobiales bacterium]
MDWALIGIFVAIVAVAALLFGMISSAKRRRIQAAQKALDRRISHVVKEAEWAHDQGSLDLVADTDTGDELRAEWEEARPRLHALGTEATALADDAPDEQLRQELQALCYALDLLTEALATHVGLRLGDPQDPASTTSVPASLDAVEQHRHDLMVAIMPLSRRV